jgi:hypothetical protein
VIDKGREVWYTKQDEGRAAKEWSDEEQVVIRPGGVAD